MDFGSKELREWRKKQAQALEEELAAVRREEFSKSMKQHEAFMKEMNERLEEIRSERGGEATPTHVHSLPDSERRELFARIDRGGPSMSEHELEYSKYYFMKNVGFFRGR